MNNFEEQKINDGQQNVGNSFFDFLFVVVKYRKFFFTFIIVITLGATAYALLAPKWYKSQAAVLPADRTDFLSAMTGMSSLLKGFSASRGLAALTGNSESDRYVSILQSQTVKDDVIKTFDLRKVYDYEDDYYIKVVKELESNVEFEIADEGALTITVYDKDPQRAADMANFMVKRLNEISTELSTSNAKANRTFIEKRYLQSLHDIDSLEYAMKEFQEKFGVIAVTEQLEATVKTMASLYADLAKQEVQYNVLERMYGKNHPLIETAKYQKEELEKKIKEINKGSGSANQDNVNLLIPYGEAPQLANEYLKLYRNLEIQYAILEFVTPMYEQAKVEEIRNTPSVLQLDVAYAADRKAKPKGSIYALISFVSSTLIGLIIIFTLEMFSKLKADDPNKYNYILGWMKRDSRKFEKSSS